jgi:hypothetical protein
VAFLVLASIAMAFHFFITLPATVQVVRGHAKSAASNYAFLCQQAYALKMKQTGLRLARESGNSGLADDFAKQVADINANMNDFAGNYVKQISSLVEYSPRTVQRVLAETPADDDAPYRPHYWQLAVRDYGRLAAGQALPDMQAMIADCAQ